MGISPGMKMGIVSETRKAYVDKNDPKQVVPQVEKGLFNEEAYHPSMIRRMCEFFHTVHCFPV